MYKFIITLDLQKGTRDKVLEKAPIVQAATRAEEGCLQYDFFSCTDNADRLVFVETWIDEAAHAFHMEQQHTKEFIAFHEKFHEKLVFETVNVSPSSQV